MSELNERLRQAYHEADKASAVAFQQHKSDQEESLRMSDLARQARERSDASWATYQIASEAALAASGSLLRGVKG